MSIQRRKVNTEKNYFASGKDKKLDFVSTGCAIFDSVIGGGYVLGRIANLVGDKSSGKTLQAIEVCANFAKDYEDGEIHYAEAESAFDIPYAEALGMPIDRVNFVKGIHTVEDLFEHLEELIKKLDGKPCLYIVDSLDALSDRAELARKIDEGSYNMAKQKLLSQLFRRLAEKIEQSRILLLIISQIRDKIGVTFGETKTRSGGKALDFYCSQVIWLAEIEKIKKTIDKVERVIGIRIQAKCKKNKIGLPFRECKMPIFFGWGIDDLLANIEWLLDVGKESRLAELELSKSGYKIRINNLRDKGGGEIKALREKLTKIVQEEWTAIETKFLPTSRKY